jgi:hypothetical protein
LAGFLLGAGLFVMRWHFLRWVSQPDYTERHRQ